MTTLLKHNEEREDRELAIARTLVGTAAETHQPHGAPAEERPEVRTCTHCGEHVPFRIDPAGSWAECTVCGHLG